MTPALPPGVRIRLKSDSRLCRLIGFFWPAFMVRFWSTFSARTIWAPVGTPLDKLGLYEGIIAHELCHVRAWKRWPIIGQFAYLFLPVPIFGAYCRFRFEAAAYLVDLRAGRMTVDAVVDTLHKHYLRPWPRRAMRKWFQRALAPEVT